MRTARVRLENLPPEYELDRLVRNLQNRHSSWSLNTPLSEWRGVQYNERAQISITWRMMQLAGTLELSHLSCTVEEFDTCGNFMSGDIALNSLPLSLRHLNLGFNNFSGPIDLTSLPPSLELLCLSNNGFSGEICLTQLPPKLLKLYLQGNAFSGAICLSELPPILTYVNLENNAFSGAVYFENLPSSLSTLILSTNEHLYGEITKTNLLFTKIDRTNITIDKSVSRQALGLHT